VALATPLRENPTGAVAFAVGVMVKAPGSRGAESPPENRVRGKSGGIRPIYGGRERVATTPDGPRIGPSGGETAI